MKKNYEPVVFEDSQGNIISNDPIFLAQKTLAQSGVDLSDSSAEIEAALVARTEELAEKDQEIADLRAALEAAKSSEAELEDDEEEDQEDPEAPRDEEGNRTYKELDGPALKSLAKKRGIDISGLSKVGEVRQAIIDADAAEATE